MISTFDQLEKNVEHLHITPQPIVDNRFKVIYNAYDVESMAPTSDFVFLSASNYDEAYRAIINWAQDPNYWFERGERLIVSTCDDDELEEEMKTELYKLGFKTVHVEWATFNFVTVKANYCYKDNNGSVKYDGELFIERVGNYQKTLEYIKNWVKENPWFVPTTTCW